MLCSTFFQLPAQVIKPLSPDDYPNVTANVTTTAAPTPDPRNGTQVCMQSVGLCLKPMSAAPRLLEINTLWVMTGVSISYPRPMNFS